MIKKIIVFFLLLTPICLESQSIIEKFRSEANARDPIKRLIRNTDDTKNAIEDFNNNGTLDLEKINQTFIV